ncbi:uncharacterized protein LOC118764135 [Octopus sinensis]|uniref:Uncharacterized protein LOC118764135 n=1 Tax=Octopus sinensis TaxID=2607531 RepID=A0A7E6EZZ4_9MOLL|nr:uncharacterized protein LOC118764135 [Octopus sinensis]
MRKRWKRCTTNLPDIIYNNIKHSIGIGLLLSFLALLLPSGVSTLQPDVLHRSSSHSTPSVEIDQIKTKEFNTDDTKDKDISRLVDRSEDMIRAQDEEESRIWPSKSAAKRKIQNHLCPKPLIPDNGYILGKNYNSGSTVYIRCRRNYYLVGPSQMKCRTIHYLFKTIVKWDSPGQRYCKKYPLRDQMKPIYPYSLHTSRSQPILVFWGKSLPWRLYF